MTTLGTGFVYVNDKKETFSLYKEASATKHAASDDITLKAELIRALNAADNKKENQGNGVYRFRINGGKGYLVYKINLNGVPNTACVFHYHWNYTMDLPLTVD